MPRKTLLLVTRNGLGSVAEADHAFGREMFDKLIHTYEAAAEKPWAIAFYTDGVKLAVKGSPAVLGLKLLEGLGVCIVLCQSCLLHFGLHDQVAVGTVGGMKDIVALMNEADKVVTV